MYYFSESTGADDGVNFEFLLRTDSEDFDTYNTKFGSRLVIIGDRVPGTLYVRWSDDDYNTWTTPRGIDLDTDLPMLTQLGKFRRRAHEFSWIEPEPLRLYRAEININIGQR